MTIIYNSVTHELSFTENNETMIVDDMLLKDVGGSSFVRFVNEQEKMQLIKFFVKSVK